jgi:hypothetical protein
VFCLTQSSDYSRHPSVDNRLTPISSPETVLGVLPRSTIDSRAAAQLLRTANVDGGATLTRGNDEPAG